MKVTMRVQISGTRDGREWPAPGESVDLPKDEAEQMIAAGLAEHPETATAPASETAAEPAVETATAPTPETATAPRARRKG